ncbi:MAG: hypothetical protein QM619_07485, partial [Micropruina sp.]|uniref:hypothetical protein n=1 Tax=Micropruina sp. TaxID=2737536 RepID=UPI0039E6D731
NASTNCFLNSGLNLPRLLDIIMILSWVNPIGSQVRKKSGTPQRQKVDAMLRQGPQRVQSEAGRGDARGLRRNDGDVPDP